ncbi:MAG: MDR family MFS transporter [Candidatus Dormiibacterota bacterium]
MSGLPTGEGKVDPALRRLGWVLVLGGIAPALDTTIVNVALQTLGRAMHASVTTTQWTLTGYLLAMGIAMPVSTWATRQFGGKRLWLFSLALFVASSALSGAAWNMTSLICFRVLQGVAAGLLMPLIITLLVQAAGPQRLGRLMAIVSLPIVVVPILGPVIGGLVVNDLGWRWIFYVNVPICLAAIVLAWRLVPPSVPRQQSNYFDLVGLLLLSPGLALVIDGFSQATGRHGLLTTATLIPLLIGAALVGGFAWHGTHTQKTPLVNLRVFRTRSFSASACVFLLAGLSLYGPMLLLALYYQQVQGKSVLFTGLLLAPQGIGSLVPRTIAGKLTDRIGARPVVVVGLLLTAVGTLAFALAGRNPDDWWLAASLLVRGAGLASATIAVMAGAFRDVPKDQVPDASTTMRIVQQVGGSLGATVLAVILAGQLASAATTRVTAFDVAFWWAIGFSLLALLPALFLPTLVRRRRAV